MGTLQIKNVSLELGGKKILDNISVDFWQGYTHAIVGANGAGKSSLSYAIMGLTGYRDIQGDILFNGESIKNYKINERAEKGLTLAWQEPARFEGLKVKDYIKISAKDKSDQNIINALELVGLNPDEYLERAVDKTLSGGERKRIELATIVVMEPKILFLDEPDSGIDVAALEKIFEMIKVLKEKGSTVILVTHSPTVLHQADHAFLMCRGKIIDKGTSTEISRYFEDKCLVCPGDDEECEEVIEREVK
jgi:Fe-S cluster assembly ATP-binding protein